MRKPGIAPKTYKNRFQKSYYKRRDVVNAERKNLYHTRRELRVCVRCGGILAPDSKLFCMSHNLKPL